MARDESQNEMIMRTDQICKANRWTSFGAGKVIKGKWNENN